MKTKMVKIALDSYGSFLGAEKGCLVVKNREGKVTKYPLSENPISEIELRSRNHVSVGALVTAAYWGIDLTISTSRGHPISLLRPLTDLSHVETRVNQFDIWKNHRSVGIAKQFVLAKLKGCNKVLRKYGEIPLDEYKLSQRIKAIEGKNAQSINARLTGEDRSIDRTYYENVIVDKTLSLTGENKESTIIDGESLSHVVDLKANSVYLSGFTIQNGVAGILADHTHYHTIENNIVQNSIYGIHLQYSQSNRFNDNLIIDNVYGFHIDDSGSNTLKRNAMNDNYYNFYLYLLGWLYDFEFVQYIDTSNTVNGKPICWWMHESNRQVPTDAGYVVIVGSYNILIKDLELTRNGQGVVLLGTYNSTIENVTLRENERGISIHGFARYNTIRGNRITNNGDGITVEESSDNIIERNSIANNGRGIVTVWGSNNRFCQNNIIDNAIQVDNPVDFYSTNYWDDGYPSGGNYWSDYNGTDSCSGSYQNETGSDGIGDISYVIGADNVDQYPLVNPFTPLLGDCNDDRAVDISDLVIIAAAFGSVPGQPRWTAAADQRSDNIINLLDLVLVAMHYGETRR